jgi:hypothetical protein
MEDKMKTAKIVSQTIKAKELGYEFIASVVKSVFSTTYYHVVSIDDVIAEGKWIPAPCGSIGNSGAHGRIGTKTLPPKTVCKSTLNYIIK